MQPPFSANRQANFGPQVSGSLATNGVNQGFNQSPSPQWAGGNVYGVSQNRQFQPSYYHQNQRPGNYPQSFNPNYNYPQAGQLNQSPEVQRSLSKLEQELQVAQNMRPRPVNPKVYKRPNQPLSNPHLYQDLPESPKVFEKTPKRLPKKKSSFDLLKVLQGFFHVIFSAGVPATAIAFMLLLGLQSNGNLLVTGNPFLTPSNIASASGLGELDPVRNSTRSESLTFLSDTLKPEALPEESFLEVPLIQQEFALSCEVAALEMALAYYDIETSQQQLLDEVGYAQPQKLTLVRPGYYVWGDPEVGFVGDVNGWFSGQRDGETKLEYGTGWGVNNGPIARVAKNYRPDSEEVDGANSLLLRKAISEGYPVLWWHRRSEAQLDPINVYTSSGEVRKFQEMHVSVLYGYDKDEEGNYRYHFNDPYFEQVILTEGEMLEQWKAHDNEIVIVR